MSIGIVTFHNVINFGACLQSYALMRTLQTHYGDTQIVNYKSPVFYNRKKVKLFDKSLLSALFSGHLRSAWIYGKQRAKECNRAAIVNKGFARFDKLYKLSREVTTAEQINALGIDHLVLGSDQIWTNAAFDPVYWGEGLKGNILSYAASGLVEDIDADKASLLKNNFQNISVREKTAQQILQNAGIDATLVLDPVLLADKAELDRLSEKPKHTEKYLFCYNLGNDEKTHTAAAAYAQKLSLPLVEITGNAVVYTLGNKQYRCTDPAMFVGLIANAEMVVTNSFHATVVSLIYHKVFASLLFRNRTRIPDLLEQFEITDRIYDDNSRPSVENDIDWARFEQLLQEQKAAGHRYLKQALQGGR